MPKTDLQPFYEIERTQLPEKTTSVLSKNKLRIGGGNDIFSIKGGNSVLINRNIDMNGNILSNVILSGIGISDFAEVVTFADTVTFTGTATFNNAANRGNFVRLSTQSAATSATIDFTTGIDSTYDEYVLTVNDLKVATDGAELYLRISTDSGATFKAGASDYIWGQAVVFGGGGVFAGSAGATHIEIGANMGNASDEGFSGEIYIYNPSSAALHKRINVISSWIAADANIVGIYASATYITDNDAINALRVLADSGNLTSGTFTLYGRKTN